MIPGILILFALLLIQISTVYRLEDEAEIREQRMDEAAFQIEGLQKQLDEADRLLEELNINRTGIKQ